MTTYKLRSSLAALAVSALAVLAAPLARAQLSFTVNEFTTSTLSVTINPGTLLTAGGPPSNTGVLFLVDGEGTNTSWVVGSSTPMSGGGAFGTASFVNAIVENDNGLGDYVGFVWSSNLSTAGDLVTALTFTVSSPGLFNPSAVSNWSLYWGDPIFSGDVLQSAGSAVTGGGSSPIPEPSSFAALAGIAGLGFAVTRRRRAQG